MKRLFWLILGAIAVWFFARRRMDTLYAENSRLQEIERKYDVLLEKETRREASFVIPEDDAQEFEERMAKASPEKKMRVAMLNALYKDEARNASGEHMIDEEDES